MSLLSCVLLSHWVDEADLLFADAQILEDTPRSNPPPLSIACVRDKKTSVESKRKLSDVKPLKDDQFPSGANVHECCKSAKEVKTTAILDYITAL